jgi:hypothetical protein
MCEYCNDKRGQKDLLKERDTVIYIEPNYAEIRFEHTRFFNDIEDPFSGDEEKLYKEIKINYCPMCGAKLAK